MRLFSSWCRSLSSRRKDKSRASYCVTRRRSAPEAIVYTASILTNKQYVRGVTAFDAKLLPELAPQLFAQKRASHAPSDAVSAKAHQAA